MSSSGGDDNECIRSTSKSLYTKQSLNCHNVLKHIKYVSRYFYNCVLGKERSWNVSDNSKASCR